MCPRAGLCTGMRGVFIAAARDGGSRAQRADGLAALSVLGHPDRLQY
jgi:hypothetical protein